ncbi:hypothetical protein CX676_20390 (plasmid) [Paracoccus zhejiangensis]|uniref:Calcium-binding protein n=2 Tax=Paracoccus zhejiangensis TaxID=1077935 RepID=A0A2H5F540_9RHOB|nr:hypothetical protein CX676_20390 [Paracoccus zhejiangensis]
MGDGQDNHIVATTFAGPGGARHVYAQGGNDVVHLDFAAGTKNFWLGHHARGDADMATNRGHDVFNFTNISNVRAGQLVVGRIEDLDYSRDRIQIEGRDIDLFNLPRNVKIVEFNGAHNDPGATPQQWLLITTPTGGKIFYALEGARADMNGNGISNNGNSEAHFVDREYMPDFSKLKEVSFVYKHNYVPHGFEAEGGIIFNDDDMHSGGYRDADGSLISRASILRIIFGTNNGDLLAGGLNNDKMSGLAGNDRIWGGSGRDTLRGESGNDTLDGGTGNDLIAGGVGDDFLMGQSGNDRLAGGLGADRLVGGLGYDLALYSSATTAIRADLLLTHHNSGEAAGDSYASVENLTGSRFGDNLAATHGKNVIDGGAGHDWLHGRGGNDVLVGGDGNDKLNGGLGRDVLNGGAGSDTADYSTARSAVRVDFLSTSLNRGEASGDRYSSIENISGSRFNDILSGSNGRNSMNGDAGNDRIFGHGGNDRLLGGDGNDNLYGGAGRDVMNGGLGSDTANYSTATSSVRADLVQTRLNRGEAAGDSYAGIENIAGSRFSDILVGDNNRNVLIGNSGRDALHGRAGNDLLSGGNGNDLLNGGSGSDVAVGGSGADTFVFARGHDRFAVNDFQDDLDNLDLRAFNFSSTSAAMSRASQQGHDVLFDFGGGDVLTVRNTHLGDLVDDLMI